MLDVSYMLLPYDFCTQIRVYVELPQQHGRKYLRFLFNLLLLLLLFYNFNQLMHTIVF